MSKSLGNIFLTRDFIAKYSAETLRFLLLSAHYRSPIDFSEPHVRESQSALHRFYSTVRKAQTFVSATGAPSQATEEEARLLELGKSFPTRWKEAMEDDFNTARVVGMVFEYVRALNGYLDRKGFKATGQTAPIARLFLDNRQKLSSVLNIFGEDAEPYLKLLRETVLGDRGLSAAEIEKEIATRAQARQNKDYAAADAARKRLLDKGIELKDSPTGTEWDVVFQA
jgi:cysteinyl-tRNA synthetase